MLQLSCKQTPHTTGTIGETINFIAETSIFGIYDALSSWVKTGRHRQ